MQERLMPRDANEPGNLVDHEGEDLQGNHSCNGALLSYAALLYGIAGSVTRVRPKGVKCLSTVPRQKDR
jgi:hypothetical protein